MKQRSCSINIKAITKVRVMVFTKEKFIKLLQEFPDIKTEIKEIVEVREEEIKVLKELEKKHEI